MAQLNFPDSPSVGDVYPNTGASRFRWDGTVWQLLVAESELAGTQIGFLPPGHEDHSGGENDGEIILGNSTGDIISALPVDVRADGTIRDADNGLIGIENGRIVYNVSTVVQAGDERPVNAAAVQTALDNLPAGHSDIGGILSITATENKVAEIGIYDTDSARIGQQFVISTVNSINDIQDININSEPSSGEPDEQLAQRLEITLNKATAITSGELRVPTAQAVLNYVASIETNPVTADNVRAILHNDTGVGGISWSIDPGTGNIVGIASIGSKQDVIDADNAGDVRTVLNVADGADVTPEWVPEVNPNYLTSIPTDVIRDADFTVTDNEVVAVNIDGTAVSFAAGSDITAAEVRAVLEDDTGNRGVQWSIDSGTGDIVGVANEDTTKQNQITGNSGQISIPGAGPGGTALTFTGGGPGDVTAAQAANATTWQETFRGDYAGAVIVTDQDPARLMETPPVVTGRQYVRLAANFAEDPATIPRPHEDIEANGGDNTSFPGNVNVGLSWRRLLLPLTVWNPSRRYIVGDTVLTVREDGVTEAVVCTIEHDSTDATNPADVEHINYTTNGEVSLAQPWRPVTAAISVRTAVVVPDPVAYEGGTGADLDIVATTTGVGVNAGRFGIRLGAQGTTGTSITGDDLPQIGTTWRFGETYDVSTPLYTLEAIVQEPGGTLTTFYFGGAAPDPQPHIGLDHIWQVMTVETFGQTDSLRFNDEQFNLVQAVGGVTDINISTPALRFAGRTEFLESLMAPTGATISVSEETLTYTPSGGSAVEIDFDEFLHPVGSAIDQDVNAILVASSYDHGNTVYIDSQDAYYYIAQSGGHFHLTEIALADELATEMSVRAAVDVALQDNINAEAATRAEDDAAETVSRIAGDEAERDFVETTLYVDPADSQSYYQFAGQPAIFAEDPAVDYGITIAMPGTITDTEALVQAENIGETTKVFKLTLRYGDGANDTKQYVVTTGGYNFTISDERTSETYTLPTIEGTYVAASVHINGTSTRRQDCFLAIGGWYGRIAQVDMAHVLNVSNGDILAGRSLEVGQDYSEHIIADNNGTAVVGLVFDNQTTGSHTGINAYALQRRNRIVRYRAATSGGLFSFRNGNSVVDRFNPSRVPDVVSQQTVDESNWLGLKLVTIQNAISGTSAGGDTNRLTFAVSDKMLTAFGEATDSASAGISIPGIAVCKNPSTFDGGSVNLGLFYPGGNDPSEEYGDYSSATEANFNAHIYDFEYSNASGSWTFFFGGETVGETAIATKAAGFHGTSIWNMTSISTAVKAGAGGIIRSVNLGGNIAGLASDTHFWVTTELGALWVSKVPWLAAGYGSNALLQAHVNANDPTSDTKRDFTFRGFQYFDQHGSIGAGDDGHIYRLVINPEVTFSVTFGNITHTARYRFNDDTADMHAFFGNPASYSPTLVGAGVSLTTTAPGGEPNDQLYLDYAVNGQNTPVVSYQWVGVLSTTDDDFETYSPFRRIDLANTVVDIHYPDGGATYHIALSSNTSDYTTGAEANGAVDQIVASVNTHTAQGHSAVRVDAGFADTITNTKPVLRLDQTGTHALQNAPVITITHPSGSNTGTLSVARFADGGYDTIGRPGGLFNPNRYDTGAEVDAKLAAIASTHGYSTNIVPNAGNDSTQYTRLERLQVGTQIYDTSATRLGTIVGASTTEVYDETINVTFDWPDSEFRIEDSSSNRLLPVVPGVTQYRIQFADYFTINGFIGTIVVPAAAVVVTGNNITVSIEDATYDPVPVPMPSVSSSSQIGIATITAVVEESTDFHLGDLTLFDNTGSRAVTYDIADGFLYTSVAEDTGKQDSLSNSQIAVVNGDPFNESNYRTASSQDILDEGKQDSLGEAALAVLAGDPFSTDITDGKLGFVNGFNGSNTLTRSSYGTGTVNGVWAWSGTVPTTWQDVIDNNNTMTMYYSGSSPTPSFSSALGSSSSPGQLFVQTGGTSWAIFTAYFSFASNNNVLQFSSLVTSSGTPTASGALKLATTNLAHTDGDAPSVIFGSDFSQTTIGGAVVLGVPGSGGSTTVDYADITGTKPPADANHTTPAIVSNYFQDDAGSRGVSYSESGGVISTTVQADSSKQDLITTSNRLATNLVGPGTVSDTELNALRDIRTDTTVQAQLDNLTTGSSITRWLTGTDYTAGNVVRTAYDGDRWALFVCNVSHTSDSSSIISGEPHWNNFNSRWTPLNLAGITTWTDDADYLLGDVVVCVDKNNAANSGIYQALRSNQELRAFNQS